MRRPGWTNLHDNGYDPEALVMERRLEPVSLVAGRDPYDQEVEDLSEP